MAWKWQRGDVARHTGGDLAAALGRITAKTFVIPIDEDMFFPPRDCRAEQEHDRRTASCGSSRTSSGISACSGSPRPTCRRSIGTSASCWPSRPDPTCNAGQASNPARLSRKRHLPPTGPRDDEDPQVGGGTPPETRTRNPLAGSRVISHSSSLASVLVSGRMAILRSWWAIRHASSNDGISVDQNGRSIMLWPAKPASGGGRGRRRRWMDVFGAGGARTAPATAAGGRKPAQSAATTWASGPGK